MPISINGKAYDVPADARVSLLDLLRDRYPSTLPALQPAHENVRSFASDTRNGLSAFHPVGDIRLCLDLEGYGVDVSVIFTRRGAPKPPIAAQINPDCYL